MSIDSETDRAAKRGPSRLDLLWLTVQMHGRLIVWVVGLLVLTLGLSTFGILQSVTVGEPLAHGATVVDVPSSKSLHVQVELDDGKRMMVPRGDHSDLLEGDAVTVTETANALGSAVFRLSAIDAD